MLATYIINTLSRTYLFIGIALLIKNIYDKIEKDDESLWHFIMKTFRAVSSVSQQLKQEGFKDLLVLVQKKFEKKWSSLQSACETKSKSRAIEDIEKSTFDTANDKAEIRMLEKQDIFHGNALLDLLWGKFRIEKS